MQMLHPLKFVQGAIQRNGVTPELEHFIIKDGRITGFNGYMALSAPLGLDLTAMPKATTFHRAMQACGDTIAISMTESGRLKIVSGAFSALVPCIDRVIYEAEPQGERFPAPPGLAQTFARMLPFIGDDASRPWAMGLSIGEGAYTATNNVILYQVWDGHALPAINCPRFAVAEVARLKEDPVELMIGEGSLSFLYPDGRWLRTQVLADDWPVDTMRQILDRPSAPLPVPDGFFDAVDTLAPFAADGPLTPIRLTGDGMWVQNMDGTEAEVALAGLPPARDLAFRLKALQMLKGELQAIDFSLAPSPCLFFGSSSRGALIGMNL